MAANYGQYGNFERRLHWNTPERAFCFDQTLPLGSGL
jgi:hypothetical protein